LTRPRRRESLALLFVAEGVKAKVYFRAAAHRVKGRTFLQVEDMKMDFSVRDIKMGIENLHNGNTVLRKCSSNMATGWLAGWLAATGGLKHVFRRFRKISKSDC